MSFQYNIKAIPTTYAGVNFRSRLEARWAAFFDLVGWEWDYEPFDLNGWTPDFLLKTSIGHVLAEVKPIDVRAAGSDALIDVFLKALHHALDKRILLLGLNPPGMALHTIEGDDVLSETMAVPDGKQIKGWREAGNLVQWLPDNGLYPSMTGVRSMLSKLKEEYRK